MKLNKNIDNYAMDLRREWGIDFYSPIDIVSLVLEKMDKLTIIWMEIDDEVSGCCSKDENGNSIILINSSQSKGRQNFTLAHELYHILYGESSQFFCCNSLNNDIEKEADKFASSLLLPQYALREYKKQHNIKEWSIKDIIKCEQFFQISHKNMLYRLKMENWISSEDFERFKFGVKKEATKLGFSIDLYEPSKENRKFYTLGYLIPFVDKIYTNDKISKGLKNEILIKSFRSDIAYGIKDDPFFD
ncbi:MAG: ImmA/IrrE family metallo-endopeptidase [Methanobacteriaceae archaeon]|nr:ImmA/IrrE family metallo-endopeptidase [Methanobacteriaceae archaeon]